MNPKLQAGIELVFEKQAADTAGVGLLSQRIKRGLNKFATEHQGVQQEHASVNTTPSSNSSPGMEEKNRNYGKGAEYKLDDDPSKGNGAQQTGEVQSRTAGTNVTVEPHGMPDLGIGNDQHTNKQASANRAVLSHMLRGILG